MRSASSDGAFVLLDSVAFSRRVLQRFVAAARRSPAGAYTCALPRGIAIDNLGYIDGLDPREAPGTTRQAGAAGQVWTAPFHFIRGTASLASTRRRSSSLTRRASRRFRFTPVIDGKREEQFAISENYLCNVSHWVLRPPRSTSRRSRRGGSTSLAGAADTSAVSPGTPGARCVVSRGRGGRLQDGLRLRQLEGEGRTTPRASDSRSCGAARPSSAFANVDRCSFICEGANVGDGAQVYGSIIGPGAWVGRNSVVVGSLVYPGALAGQILMQVSLIGREACAFTNSGFYDLNFSRTVRVAHRGRIVDSGSQFLGVCVGPEARVSAGVWVASGREIPRGAVLVKPPSEIASRIGELPPGEPHVVRDGVVVPLANPRSQ